MIARLEVTRGELTEFPLAEKVRGGWQNGVTFYPDTEVTKITPLHVAPEPQGEPSDAQIGEARDAGKWMHLSIFGNTGPQDKHWWDIMRAALRAVNQVK